MQTARIVELRAIRADIASAASQAELTRLYSDLIGYDPFEDDDTATIESVRAILHDYVKEVAASENIHWSRVID